MPNPAARRCGSRTCRSHICRGIDALTRVLDRYGNDDIGIVYDVANAHFIDEDIRAGLIHCGKRLRLVHLSDTGQRQYRHDAVGQGSVPFRDIPAMLRAVDYRELPMIEIISRNADKDILDSVERLWLHSASRQRQLSTDGLSSSTQ